MIMVNFRYPAASADHCPYALFAAVNAMRMYTVSGLI